MDSKAATYRRPSRTAIARGSCAWTWICFVTCRVEMSTTAMRLREVMATFHAEGGTLVYSARLPFRTELQHDEQVLVLAPEDDGSCPVTHPIKANDNSGIFHVPGGRFYDRTKAERCYASADGAIADGYRQAKS